MNFDPATSTLTLDLLATTGFGCVMVYLGKGIVRRVKAFQDWSLPAPVIGGLIVALILSFLKSRGIFTVQWTSTLSSHLMNLFFTCVGFGFSRTLLDRGKKFCAGIALSVLLLVLLQGILGIAVASALGMHPLMGIQIGTGALAGGVGTTSAFGPVYESMGAVGCVKLVQNRKPQQGCCLPGSSLFLFCLVQFWWVFSPIYPPGQFLPALRAVFRLSRVVINPVPARRTKYTLYCFVWVPYRRFAFFHLLFLRIDFI